MEHMIKYHNSNHFMYKSPHYIQDGLKYFEMRERTVTFASE